MIIRSARDGIAASAQLITDIGSLLHGLTITAVSKVKLLVGNRLEQIRHSPMRSVGDKLDILP
jgi:hypothetical protein